MTRCENNAEPTPYTVFTHYVFSDRSMITFSLCSANPLPASDAYVRHSMRIFIYYIRVLYEIEDIRCFILI